MRFVYALSVMLVLAQDGFMSGRVENQSFTSRLDSQSHIYAVKVLSHQTATVREIAAVDSQVASKHCVVARIISVVQRGGESIEEPAGWTFEAPADLERIFAVARARGAQGMAVGDTIAIFNAEDINYTIV